MPRITFSILLSIGLVFLFVLCSQSDKREVQEETTLKSNVTIVEEKQRGIHLFGRIKDSISLVPFKKNNIKWITLVSWGDQKNYDSPMMTHHNGDSLAMQRHDSNWINQIKLVRAAGFKVFFKPHLWITSPSEGTWRSDVFPTNDENWELWKTSYRDFIIRYAKVAEQADAEMFCIGTEFTRLTIEKPVFWEKLIKDIRKVYSGKITYAANWYQEYEKITFWKELDYIGVQAYFPLVKNEYPTVSQISKGWKKYFPTLKAIHKTYNRPILFTEIGYKSTSNSAITPWEWIEYDADSKQRLSLETQANCYQAFFDMVWEKEWFAGLHIWSLRSDYVEDYRDDLDFTPQGKPAERIIKKGFE